ncbi:MAG TPA: preprotein translocase subunit YajC [Gemmatimonadales bacterium]|nr:preprotein translocase subunit YajC [Gemmatimonadales bacterium]
MLTMLHLMAPTDGGNAFPILLLQIGLMVAVFYLLIIRPQAQQRKRHEQMLAGLKKGDEVITSGGIIGRIKDLKDDRVTLESGGSSLVVGRRHIAAVGSAVGSAAPGPGAPAS